MGKKINANKLVSTLNMPREEWLQWRKKGLGGSNAAAAAGMSPWQSRLELYYELAHGREAEFTEEQQERMHWGSVLETPIAEEFARRHPDLKIERRNAIFQSKNHPFLLCNVDRVIFDKEKGSWGILEIKNTSQFSSTSDEWQDTGIPFHYRLQIQHMLYVLDLDWAYFAYLQGGNSFHELYILRDNDLISDLIEEECKFWEYVERKIEPPVDGSEGTTKLITSKFEADGSEIDLSTESLLVNNLREAKRQYDIAKAAFKEVSNALDLAKNELRNAMGPSEIALFQGKKIATWKESTTRRFDQKSFSSDYSDLFEKYKTENSSRTLRLAKEI